MIKTLSRGSPDFIGDFAQDERQKQFIDKTITRTKCPDVFVLKVFTEKFAEHLLEETLAHPELWSKSDYFTTLPPNKIPEELPLFKIGLELEILGILKFFTSASILRLGFTLTDVRFRGGDFRVFKQNEDPNSEIKYFPNDDFLMPTWRMVMKLGDYQGGWTHFRRYNCSLQDPAKGKNILTRIGVQSHQQAVTFELSGPL